MGRTLRIAGNRPGALMLKENNGPPCSKKKKRGNTRRRFSKPTKGLTGASRANKKICISAWRQGDLPPQGGELQSRKKAIRATTKVTQGKLADNERKRKEGARSDSARKNNRSCKYCKKKRSGTGNGNVVSDREEEIAAA